MLQSAVLCIIPLSCTLGSVASWPLWRAQWGDDHLVQSTLTLQLPLWESQRDHFFCEVPVLIKLVKWTPLSTRQNSLWLVSYSWWCHCHSSWCPMENIAQAVLKIKSALGRRKAFRTCSSHVMVVIIFMELLSSCISSQPRVDPRTRESLCLFYTADAHA